MRDLEVAEFGVEVCCTVVPIFTRRAKKDCDLVERFKALWEQVEVEKVVRRNRRGADI